MKFSKILIFLSLICLLLALGSCTDQNQPDDSVTTDEETQTEAETNPNEPFDDNVSKIKVAGGGVAANVVIPVDANSSLIEFGKNVAARITKQTGIESKVTDDYLKAGESYDSQAVEILIGLTDYPETKQVLSELKYGTAIIKVVGNKIVVNATDEKQPYGA